jgi:hypothetical protein
MSGDGRCPRCRLPLHPDLGTPGWIDSDGRSWETMALFCLHCGIYFGRSDTGRLVEAADIVGIDDELDP